MSWNEKPICLIFSFSLRLLCLVYQIQALDLLKLGFIQAVEQVNINVVKLKPLQLVIQERVKVFFCFNKECWKLRVYMNFFAVTILESLTKNHFAGAFMVWPCRIQVIYSKVDAFADNLYGALFIHFVP